MDISLLSRMVKELVLKNDRVSLPGLGIFACEYVPASFSDKGFVINPPYRRVFFRSRKEDDGILVSFYAKENGLDESLARKSLEACMAGLKSELETKRVVEFPGFGKLRSTKENTLFFVASPDLDIYPDGFGLSPVSLKSNEEVPDADVLPVSEKVETVQEPVRRWWRPVLLVAGAVVLLLAIFVIAARLFPEMDFINRLLYSEDELELLKWAGYL